MNQSYLHPTLSFWNIGCSKFILLSIYSSSKYAAYGFAEALNEELRILGKTGIHTTTVCPMFVDTGLVKTPKDR